jgi:hypothetical protein
MDILPTTTLNVGGTRAEICLSFPTFISAVILINASVCRPASLNRSYLKVNNGETKDRSQNGDTKHRVTSE